MRTWTHLERQRGGFGFLGGPGEAQIETDRRLIDERIERIRKRARGRRAARATLHRAGRKRVPYPIVALVGYTNAGKSTLFNRLTGAGVVAKDQLFATLDPTMREVRLPSGRRIILSDTVGFISDLPTTLVAAFRATLEEVMEADLILHVRDIAIPRRDAQAPRRRGACWASSASMRQRRTRRILEVWNKVDRLDAAARTEAERGIGRARTGAARAGLGADRGGDRRAARGHRCALRRASDEILSLEIPPREGRLLSWLYDNAEVLEQQTARSGAVTAARPHRSHHPGQARGPAQARRADGDGCSPRHREGP